MSLDSSKFTGLARFHTTRWSVVVRAQSPATAGAEESLESLCHQYWPPLYAYVRGRGHPPHDAQDLTRQFFARLLEKNRQASLKAPDGGSPPADLAAEIPRLEARDRELRERIRSSGSPPIEQP